MVEGKGSKTWEKAKQFCFTQPQLAHQLLQKITDITIKYLKAQTKAGADVVQVFDSWSGCLSPNDFKTFAHPYLIQIADALKDDAPVILFPKGSWYALQELSKSSASGLGIDWCITPQYARELTNNNITLQGNFDPAKLLLPIPEIKKAVHEMIDAFGVQNYIANLGHGITPKPTIDFGSFNIKQFKVSPIGMDCRYIRILRMKNQRYARCKKIALFNIECLLHCIRELAANF
jgi:uroporphyrinogen decarboxylase